MTIKELKKMYTYNWFATDKAISSAMDYSYSLIETLPKCHKHIGYTALHIMMNTLLNDCEKIELKEM